MVTIAPGRLLAGADLRYAQQVERSEAGLPIGNGRHGTLVWTEPDRVRMQVNRVDVFARDASITEGEECDWAGACAFVDVILGERALPADRTVQHLSVHDALATVRGPEITIRVFAARDRDAILLEIEDRRREPPPLTVELRAIRPLEVRNRDLLARSRLETRDDQATLTQRFEARDHLCRSAVTVGWGKDDVVIAPAGETALRITRSERGGRAVLAVTSAAALDDPTDPKPAAHAVYEEAHALGFDAALVEHRESWREFWSRSFVHATSEDGDAQLLAEHWAWTMYVMGSASRGVLPAKFNGMIWGTDGDKRRWGSEYWWWNTQIIYRPLTTANHGELMRPLFDMFAGMRERARVAARQQWGSEGIFLGETTSFDGLEELPEGIATELRDFLLARKTYEQTSEEFRAFAEARNGYDSRFNWLHKRSTAPFSWVTHILFSGAQIAWQHWLHWEHTLDEEFLRERAYPLVRGVAEFYRHFPNLRLGDDGVYHLHGINDQELIWGTRDPHNEIWAMRGILATAIAASEILGVDEELRPRWRELADHLAPPPLSTDPDLVEGCFFPHESGRPVWALARAPARHIEGFESDTLVRPCVDYDQWTLESTDAAMTRIAHDTFDSEPSRLRFHEGQHAYALSETPLAAAALGRAEDVRVILPLQLKRGLLPNRLSLEDGEQAQTIEPIATVATATQLALLQSVPPITGGEPVIRVFPAWPREWDATFDLLARRGFRVRAAMRGGEVRFVEILSQLGGECRVRDPFGAGVTALHRAGGRPVLLTGSLLAFPTAAGERVVLLPEGVSPAERRVVVP